MTDAFAAVVYDLDGTLVRLAVDWDAVRTDVAALLRDHGVDPDPYETWELLDVAEEHGIGDEAHDRIAAHEQRGARTSTRLPLAAELESLDTKVGVLSLNAESACHIALDIHDLASAVDVVAGRDTPPARKPDPRSLRWVLDELGVDPGEAVFVGDSDVDAVTAERAGTDFRWA